MYLIQHPDGLRIKQTTQGNRRTWVLESRNPDKRRYPDERIPIGQSELLIIVVNNFIDRDNVLFIQGENN